jgi:hypothetical protein
MLFKIMTSSACIPVNKAYHTIREESVYYTRGSHANAPKYIDFFFPRVLTMWNKLLAKAVKQRHSYNSKSDSTPSHSELFNLLTMYVEWMADDLNCA